MRGTIYPRSGAISQTHNYKVAAMIAMRVANLVTRGGQARAYKPQTASSLAGYGPPPGYEGESDNHRWQSSPEKISRLFGFPGS